LFYFLFEIGRGIFNISLLKVKINIPLWGNSSLLLWNNIYLKGVYE